MIIINFFFFWQKLLLIILLFSFNSNQYDYLFYISVFCLTQIFNSNIHRIHGTLAYLFLIVFYENSFFFFIPLVNVYSNFFLLLTTTFNIKTWFNSLISAQISLFNNFFQIDTIFIDIWFSLLLKKVNYILIASGLFIIFLL